MGRYLPVSGAVRGTDGCPVAFGCPVHRTIECPVSLSIKYTFVHPDNLRNSFSGTYDQTNYLHRSIGCAYRESDRCTLGQTFSSPYNIFCSFGSTNQHANGLGRAVHVTVGFPFPVVATIKSADGRPNNFGSTHLAAVQQSNRLGTTIFLAFK